MPSRFAQALSQRVLVCDGAMGTSIHKLDLSVERDYCGCENCTDILVKSRPDVIQTIHESFLKVGADCVETDSFGASKLVLGEFGLTEQCFELNKRAADVARAACNVHHTADKPRFVLGSIGPGTRLVTLGNTDWGAMFDSYLEQARGLLAGEPMKGTDNRHGVDAFIIETCQDLLQIKCTINAVLAALAERNLSTDDVPILVSVTIETTGTMLLGTSIEAAAAALSGYPILSLGLNCATGPTEMSEHVAWLGRHWNSGRRISVMPNAGLPVLHEGRTEYPLTPAPFAQAIARFIEHDGVNLVGGCCGTTPEHIAAVVAAVDGLGRARRDVEKRPARAAVTSLYQPTEYRQDSSFLIVGERMNASGSKKFKQLLEAEDWDGIISLAREQMRHDGAHVLDLNVDYAGRDNARDMGEIVRRLVRQVDAPLMLDSTQTRTLEAGLSHCPGKCLINSANFEDGEHKFDEICRLAKTYGAGLVIGSIDEDKEASMARTAERKLAIAQRGFERATRVHGLSGADLLFDPLVLPISTGLESDRRSALETIEGVRRISRELPDCQTTVGLSNISFGLKPAARVVLNSVFLHELREAGLTSAILHMSKILPRNRIEDAHWNAALDLIYDRRSAARGGTGQPVLMLGGTPAPEAYDPLQVFVELFKDAAQGGAAAVQAEKKPVSLEERLRAHIIDGEKQGLIESLEEARRRFSPLEIINDHLLDGMKTVGELFGSGQMQLPFVLQSAEVMKMAVAHLEQYMERAEGQTKGKIVLATVKGDVHDIGKNLVDIILTNNGYTVYNLGIKQPISAILDKWKETGADAVGMSGLLVKSVNVMEENLHEMRALGLNVPVLLGGAALTRHYCESHLRAQYSGEVFYGKDAFEGLSTMDAIVGGATGRLVEEIDARLSKRTAAEETVARSRADQARRQDEFARGKAAEGEAGGGRGGVLVRERVRSDVAPLGPGEIPVPAFFGTRVVTDIPLDQVYAFINPVALFRGQWQVKKGALSDDQYEAMLEDKIRPIFDALKARCRDERILQPAAVYGYFPCNSDGDDLIVYDPAPLAKDAGAFQTAAPSSLREIERFTFPRQADKRRLCISDFFLPAESGRVDVLGMHCVTMGRRASEEAQRLFKANDYTNYLYLHGLGVETAEALAEFWHKRMRQEMGIASADSPRVKELFTQHYRGSRYSFGYPACPDMSDQERLWRLIDPTRIGCVLTENWQIDPEQSTSALIVHHPEAKYFNV
ncbi:MAG TPA: methionine synthase [Phycisphaerales bacterium]|nr:methionine synthase [Phycisphaerales bacterium]